MKHLRCILLILTIVTLLFSLIPTAYANAAEPPCFTVIAANPPDDLTIHLRLADGSEYEPIILYREQKTWEYYYRFFYHTNVEGQFVSLEQKDIAGAVLIVTSGEDSFECPLPTDTFKLYNNLLTLNYRTQTLSTGQPILRVPMLIALRVVLTLVIEGAVLFFFGYREKKSWLSFLIVNLITQGFLNAALTGPSIGPYWYLGFTFGEIIILVTESIFYTKLLQEHSKKRANAYAIIANLLSLAAGSLFITYLPV